MTETQATYYFTHLPIGLDEYKHDGEPRSMPEIITPAPLPPWAIEFSAPGEPRARVQPYPPQCSYQPVIIGTDGECIVTGGRCSDAGTFWLVGPDGDLCPGGAYCETHTRACVEEYLAKLGERWYVEPVRLLSTRPLPPCPPDDPTGPIYHGTDAAALEAAYRRAAALPNGAVIYSPAPGAIPPRSETPTPDNCAEWGFWSDHDNHVSALLRPRETLIWSQGDLPLFANTGIGTG